MAQMGVDWRGIRVIGSVLERCALVLFTPDTTHRQACRKDKKKPIQQMMTLVTEDPKLCLGSLCRCTSAEV